MSKFALRVYEHEKKMFQICLLTWKEIYCRYILSEIKNWNDVIIMHVKNNYITRDSHYELGTCLMSKRKKK